MCAFNKFVSLSMAHGTVSILRAFLICHLTALAGREFQALIRGVASRKVPTVARRAGGSEWKTQGLDNGGGGSGNMRWEDVDGSYWKSAGEHDRVVWK